MATLSHSKSRRMYSWWWDSHISPTSSKWLQDNLSDMDSKVKAMIKLIEEDADTFARRAEMYYKKRPELMKLVEEFYRAYRALAERYSSATGVLRQAHNTMVPFELPDDSPGNSLETDPHTPQVPIQLRAGFYPDCTPKGASEVPSPNWALSEESYPVADKEGLNQFNGFLGSEAGVRKGLDFHEAEEKDQSSAQSEVVIKFEKDIQVLKDALAKLDAEKEAGLVNFQQSLERLSKLESEVCRAQEESKRVDGQSKKAESEVQMLREALYKLEAEKNASLLHYQHSLERFSKLETDVSLAQADSKRVDEQAYKANGEIQSLKEALYKLEAEAEAQTLKQVIRIVESEKDSIEKKLRIAEEDARKHIERAVTAGEQVETLKQALNKLAEEKEAAYAKYQQCLESISSLEDKLARAEDEVQRLNGEIESVAAKLNSAEERRLVLETLCELQNEELTEKQKEMGRLWTSIQEERLRFMEAETAFQTLQLSHSQTQEEVMRMKEKTKSLNEFNSSSAISMKEIQNEIFSLRDIRGKLEEEVELRADQSNALQQEIFSLKEELNELTKKYQHVLDENSNLKETSGREIAEKKALLEKMELMEELLRKNTLMENSLSVLRTELEEAREKKNSLEKSFRSLLQKKSLLRSENTTLTAQLKDATENLDKLSEKNTFLENSLLSAHEEHTELKADCLKKEEALVNEIDCLKKENLRVIEEGRSSKKECLALKEEIRTLEGEISFVLGETLSSSTLSLILNDIINETSAELKEDMYRLGDGVQDKLEEVNLESLHLREVLNYEVASGKSLLGQKEVELSEVARKLVATEIEKSELEKVVADLRMDLEEVQMIRCERERQILKLSENNHHLNMENESLNELHGARRSLRDGTVSRNAHIEFLHGRVSCLEGENGSLKCQLALCAQAVIALKDLVSSLENSTSMQTLLQKNHDNTAKGEEMSSRSSTESLRATSAGREGLDTVSELKDLLQRVRAAEKAVIRMRKIATTESIKANAKMEAAVNLIEELKFRRPPHPEVTPPPPEASDSGFLMKDIVLDKASEPSSNRTRRSGSGDYLLESWDTTLDRSIGLVVAKGHRRFSSRGGSIDDLSVDKSEISRTPSLPRQEVSKRKIMDRLNSDVQKLSNLRITVQDLTKKVDGSKKNKNHDEWDTLKDQLEEAEEAIQKLADVQSKLKRTAEEKSTMEADEGGSFRRRKLSEKAKRVSEKIGRLQLEVQKMQFLLLKLDDDADKGKKGRARVVESKRRVLLRDYLYGGRTSLRKKRAACCGCVKPSTREEED